MSSLPVDFWKNFHSKYWEKNPVAYKDPFDHQFLSQEKLFEAIVGMPSRIAADRFWASRRVPPLSRDDFQPVQLDQHGPKKQDQSLDGFFARTQQQIGNIPIGLNIHQLEKSQPEIWFKFREFVQTLNKITGELPSGRWDIDTFLGTYTTTPLGIHRDNASVFAIGVMGNRSYYTWPAEYFKQGDPALSTLDLTAIQKHLDKATRLDLGPGDLVYWPSSNWHFVTSDGLPSAVISISAYFGRKLSDVMSEQISQIMVDQLQQNDFNRKYTLSDIAIDPPQQMTDAFDLVERAIDTGQVVKALQKHWLSYYSADGLHPAPVDASAKLDPQDIISVNPKFPIIWKEVDDSELLIAANGNTHSLTTADNAVIIKILDILNSGKAVVAKEIAEKYTQGKIPVNVIANILQTLLKFRAFNKVR